MISFRIRVWNRVHKIKKKTQETERVIKSMHVEITATTNNNTHCDAHDLDAKGTESHSTVKRISFALHHSLQGRSCRVSLWGPGQCMRCYTTKLRDVHQSRTPRLVISRDNAVKELIKVLYKSRHGHERKKASYFTRLLASSKR